jgi:hypothetical protein
MNTLASKTIPLALVAVAMLAPAVATAGVRPDDRAGIRGIGATVSAASAAVRPDDRAGIRGVRATVPAPVVAVRPDDRAGIRGPGPDVFMRAVNIHGSEPATHSPGFDWAWVYGPGAALLGALALAGSALVARARRTAVHA